MAALSASLFADANGARLRLALSDYFAVSRALRATVSPACSATLAPRFSSSPPAGDGLGERGHFTVDRKKTEKTK